MRRVDMFSGNQATSGNENIGRLTYAENLKAILNKRIFSIQSVHILEG